MRTWADTALKQLEATGEAIVVARLRGPVFDVKSGDTLKLLPPRGVIGLALVRWLDGRICLAQCCHAKGPHEFGTRLRFTNNRGDLLWIGPRHQLAAVTRMT